MDIPNLNPQTTINTSKPRLNPTITLIVLVLALTAGFWLSRFVPIRKNSTTNKTISPSSSSVIPPESISGTQDIKIGKIYGDTTHNFKDSATGLIQKGGINGEGTHTLVREGGKNQWAALTSSVLDLDLFADRKVEITGETNTSNKAGWLLDVGTIKVLE